MSPTTVEAVTKSTVLGEAPHWDRSENVLYYVDILEKEVRRYDPATKQETFAKIDEGTVSYIVPVHGQKNSFLISVGLNICLMTWDGKSDKPAKIEKLAAVGDESGREVQLNDGKADASGRFWAGTVGKGAGPDNLDLHQCCLYSYSKQKSVKKHVTGISASNGLTWTEDNKTMYYIDTLTQKVDGFDFDIENGTVSNRRTVFDLKANDISGLPDGMTIDSNGKLWIACFGGSQVIQVDPQLGKLLQIVSIPSPNVTSVAFGGSNLDELYVTTGTMFLSPEQLAKYPTAGCTYLVKGVNAKGLPMYNVKL